MSLIIDLTHHTRLLDLGCKHLPEGGAGFHVYMNEHRLIVFISSVAIFFINTITNSNLISTLQQ